MVWRQTVPDAKSSTSDSIRLKLMMVLSFLDNWHNQEGEIVEF